MFCRPFPYHASVLHDLNHTSNSNIYYPVLRPFKAQNIYITRIRNMLLTRANNQSQIYKSRPFRPIRTIFTSLVCLFVIVFFIKNKWNGWDFWIGCWIWWARYSTSEGKKLFKNPNSQNKRLHTSKGTICRCNFLEELFKHSNWRNQMDLEFHCSLLNLQNS